MALLALVALFGNGLKALVTSSVLVGEGTLATFLGMRPEQVAALMQATIAGMVVALALCPILLARYSARALGLAACAVACVAFGGFAAVQFAPADPVLRDAAAFAGLAIGAGAQALLAPVAQALVMLAPRRGTRTALTTLWTGATPAGFLLAPQAVKLLLPALGIGWYFAGVAALPVVVAVMLVLLPWWVPRSDAHGRAPASIPPRVALAFTALVLAFELWTGTGAVAGYRHPAAVLLLLVCGGTLAYFTHAWRTGTRPDALAGPNVWLLVALFVLEIPTTGFFDTSFLVSTQHPQAFISDRATLGAAAQIAGTVVMGALLHRRPAAEPLLRMAFALIAAAGVAMLAAYPWVANTAYVFAAPAVEGFGAAGLTVLLCLALVREANVHPLLAALPSMAIMLGTEFGLELLQMTYAAATAAGLAATPAYAVTLGAQVVFAAAVPLLLMQARRAGVDQPASDARHPA
ncbi:MAG: hypothetical protein U1F10_12665 [Burkholderiales bacterium]